MINVYDFKVAHPETFTQLSVRDLLFVYYRCPQVEKLLNLYNHYNMISFTLNGGRILHQGGESLFAKDGTSFFLRKSAYVQELPESPGWEVLAFYIPDEFLKQIVKEFGDHLSFQKLPDVSSKMFLNIHLNDATKTCFFSIIPYFTQKLPPNEKLLELKFKELLLNILTNPFNKNLLAYIVSLNNNFKTPIWQVMEKNYIYNLSIKELARISNRSTTVFKKDFYEYYHTTPGKWLTEKKLDYAKMLLYTSKQSISDVAYNSGFENVSHFSRIFKEKFGNSPLQYRKNRIEVH